MAKKKSGKKRGGLGGLSGAQKRAQETFKKVRKVCAIDHEPFTKGFGRCMSEEYKKLKK